MLSKEQTEAIKKQIIKHIEKGFPKDKQEFAINQIKEMNSEQIEEFLEKNNISLKSENSSQCIFCSIVSEEINSYKIDENEKAVAVLEINPISKAHALVIPKEHTPDYEKSPPEETQNLIKAVSEKIKKKLKPKSITIANSNLFGHQLINLIPNYKKKEMISMENAQRNPAKPEELSEVQKILVETKKPVKISKPKKINPKKEKIWLPKRIP